MHFNLSPAGANIQLNDQREHHVSPSNPANGTSNDQPSDSVDIKRRSSGLNPINSYNGLSNDGLYLTWSQSAQYAETAEASGAPHPPPHHHYESTTLYTPPTIGK